VTADQLEAINADFAGWHAWPSDAGRCWATRRSRPPAGTVLGAVVMTVDGDDPDQLRAAIEAEEERTVPG
jgi:hypothetical protein